MSNSLEEWADLHGEDYPKRKYFSALDWAREEQPRKGVYCRNCEDLIEYREMKPHRKDDDSVEMLCPDCGATLVEGE